MEKHSKISWSLTETETGYYIPTAMYINSRSEAVVWMCNIAVYGIKMARAALAEVKIGCNFDTKEWHRIESTAGDDEDTDTENLPE